MDDSFLIFLYATVWIVFLILGTTAAMIMVWSEKISPDTTPKGKHIYYSGFGFSVFIALIVIFGMVLVFARQIAGF